MQYTILRSVTLVATLGALMSACAPTVPIATPSPPRVSPPPPAPAPPPPAPMPAPMPVPPPPVQEKKVTLAADTYFAAASAVLSPVGKASIVDFAQKMRGRSLDAIVIGHADSKERPTEAAALLLSKARA
jgi:OOP family OmpA-OmpF porin